MRSLLCILLIILSNIYSLYFNKIFLFKKYASKDKQVQYSYKSLQKLTRALLFCAGIKLNVKGKKIFLRTKLFCLLPIIKVTLIYQF